MLLARALISAALVAAAGVAPAHAGTFSWNGSSRLGTAYDGNIGFALRDIVSDNAFTADLSGSLVQADDNYSVQLTPRIIATRHLEYLEFNRTDEFVTLTAQGKTERTNTSLSLGVTRDSTLTSELGLTGLTRSNKRHENAVLSLNENFQWTEKWTWGAQASATASRYTDAAQFGLVDYNYGSAALSASYALTSLSQLALQASAGRLQVPDFSSLDKSNYAATLSYTKQLAERWQATLSYGPSWIRSKTNNSSSTVYEASLSRRSELLNVRLSARRDVTPTGQGILSRRDVLALDFNRPISERLSASLSGNWIQNRNELVTTGVDVYAVRYLDVNAALTGQITPTWRLNLSIGHGDQHYDYNRQTARRNYAEISFSWAGRAHTIY